MVCSVDKMCLPLRFNLSILETKHLSVLAVDHVYVQTETTAVRLGNGLETETQNMTMDEITHDSIVGKLVCFIKSESGFAGIDAETKLLSAGILDSLMIVSIIGFCETEFGCSFSAEEVEENDFESIRTLANRVQAKIQAPATEPSREA